MALYWPSSKKFKKWISFRERQQFRVDLKATLCKGLPEDEIKYIKFNLRLEDTSFYISRAYVPWAFWRMYRKGIFEQ